MPDLNMRKILKLSSGYELKFSPKGSYLAVLGSKVILWNLKDNTKTAFQSFADPSSLDFSHDEKFLAIKSTSGSLEIKALETKESIFRIQRRDDGGCGPFFFEPGRQLIEGSLNGAVTILNIDEKQSLEVAHYSNALVQAMCSARNVGKIFYIVSPVATTSHLPPEPASIFCFSCEDKKICELAGHYHFPQSLASSSNAEKISITHEVEGIPSLSIIDVKMRKTLATCAIKGGRSCHWSPDDSRVAVVEEGFISVRETETLSSLEEYPLKYASDVQFSPNGRMIAVVGWNGGSLFAIEL